MAGHDARRHAPNRTRHYATQNEQKTAGNSKNRSEYDARSYEQNRNGGGVTRHNPNRIRHDTSLTEQGTARQGTNRTEENTLEDATN